MLLPTVMGSIWLVVMVLLFGELGTGPLPGTPRRGTLGYPWWRRLGGCGLSVSVKG